MKVIVLGLLCAIAIVGANGLKCGFTVDSRDYNGFANMTAGCTAATRQQIEEELKASIQYMAMGAHFLRDSINRPGFGKMFMHSATEEREHAMKLISYLLMRGELTKDVSTLIKHNYPPAKRDWEDGLAALKDALALEVQVTNKIRKLIEVCEKSDDVNDYHLVDYLTGEFLEEQYKGERELAGRISTLNKMKSQHGTLGEFLYDKNLLD